MSTRAWLPFLALALLAPEATRAEDDCGLQHPSIVFGPPVAPKPNELPRHLAGDFAPVARERRGPGPWLHAGLPNARRATGALSGKTVYVSAGHGFYYSTVLGRWATQRGNNNGVVEDLVSTETTSHYLIPMLLNAGAYVVPVREFDMNPEMVIVDDADAAYAEQGDAAAFMNSSVPGFGQPAWPLGNGVNPFALGDNRLMEAVVGNTSTASATWTLNIPKDGHYNVYITYTQFAYRVPDAHFVVRHAGGEAHFRVNQRRHGSTWVFLGNFYFRAGSDAQKGAVVALNDSSVVGNLSLDAVRIGGGRGLVTGNDSTTASPRPRFEEAARYHAQFAGAPTTVYDSASLDDRQDDVGTRARFAAWDHEDGEDAVYVAWHTNACGSTPCNSRGTDTYIYGAGAPWENAPFSGVPGSDVLAQHVHAELVGDLKSEWDPNWNDRGIHTAYFGEVNPNNNPETPAILLEIAFHHNATDAAQLKEPHFRYIAARAITQGIIKYFAAKDGMQPVLAPEPPTELLARNIGGGKVRVEWAQSPGSSGARVYSSEDGLAWDDGVDVACGQYQIDLPPGTVRYFRVSATNGGGESFPSEVVGVGVPAGGALAPVLVVNGFGRLDATTAPTENLSGYGLGSPVRAFVHRMNDGTYVRHHGQALSGNAVTFDSASASAVAAGRVSLPAYALVDWLVGRGESPLVQISAPHQALLRAYVEGGGRALVSGSNVADRLAVGSAEDQAFLSQVLRAGRGAGAGSLSFDGVAGEAFAGLTAVALDDGTKGAYPAGSPDVLVPVNGAVLAAFSGTMNAAAIRASGPGEVAFLSFPFETVASGNDREDVMARLLTALSVPLSPVPWDGGFPPLGDPCNAPLQDAGTSMPEPEPLVFAAMGSDFVNPESGCGCTSGAAGAGAVLFAIVALLPFVRRRR